MTLSLRAALLFLLSTTVAAQSAPVTPPLSPAAAAARAAKEQRRAQQLQLAKLHLSGALTVDHDAAFPQPPASALSATLPFTRPLPNSRVAIGSGFSESIAVLDSDHDGLADLATEASSGGNNPGIHLLRQRPGADFESTPLKGSFGFRMASGDVTGDGLVDVVDFGFGEAWTFVAKPEGGLLPGTGKKSVIGDFTWWAALGDVNGDGRADAALCDLFTDCKCARVALGLDTGKFAAATAVDVGPTPGGIGLADFNGDGLLDVVVLIEPASGDRVSVAPGLGDGTFAASVKSTMANAFYPMDLCIADFDLDGTLDVAALELSSQSATFEAVISMLGNGDSTFAMAGTFDCSILGNRMSCGDLDGDGASDVAVANYDDYTEQTGGGMDVLLGDGHGAFGAAVTYDLGGSPQSDVVADLDADGDLDVALGQELQGGDGGEPLPGLLPVDIGLALGRGDGRFAGAVGPSLGAPPVAAAVADLDGDGDGDLVVTRKGGEAELTGAAYALGKVGDGEVSFGPAVSIALGTDGARVQAADLDGDGLADLVLEGNVDGGTLVVARNLGPGGTGELGFALEHTLGAAGLIDLRLADLDGDGALDVLVARGEAQVEVSFNSGFTFPAASVAATAGPVSILAVADVDADGWCDALAADTGGVAQLLLDAGGTLQPQPAFVVAFSPTHAELADFDGDGALDAAFLVSFGAYVEFMAGDGEGQLTSVGPAQGFTTSSTSFAAADLDRDARADLVFARPQRRELLVRRGRGDFTFETTQSVAAALGTSGVLATDVDGDSFPDIVTCGAIEGAA
jgi:FG-GAP-like repeat